MGSLPLEKDESLRLDSARYEGTTTRENSAAVHHLGGATIAPFYASVNNYFSGGGWPAKVCLEEVNGQGYMAREYGAR